jgi:hypothetical protein
MLFFFDIISPHAPTHRQANPEQAHAMLFLHRGAGGGLRRGLKRALVAGASGGLSPPFSPPPLPQQPQQQQVRYKQWSVEHEREWVDLLARS